MVEGWLFELTGKQGLALVTLFWYFFFIDLPRNVLLDLVVFRHLLKMRTQEWKEKDQAAGDRLFQENPLVSIVSPGKNEGRHILKLVESLERQTWKNLELIVVDDGSTDDTPDICRALEHMGKIKVFLRNEVRGGKASAANLGLRYCKGKYVVHLDADSYLAADAIEKVLRVFYREESVGAVAGDIRVSNALACFSTALQNLEYMKSISVGRTVHSMLGTLRIVSGAFGAFPKEVLDRVGGWDVGPGLDGDLTQKIRKLGLYVKHESSAICYTNVPDSFTKLARQRFRWDRSLVRFRMRRHSDLFDVDANFRIRNFVSSAENIIFSVVLNFKWWAYITLALVFYPELVLIFLLANYILYFLANIVQFSIGATLYGKTMRREDWAAMLYLPLTPLYVGFYLRSVRTFAYLMEFFLRTSYRDSWNPWKVSSQVLAFDEERNAHSWRKVR